MKTQKLFSRGLLIAAFFGLSVFLGDYYVEQSHIKNAMRQAEIDHLSALKTFHTEVPSSFEYSIEDEIPYLDYFKAMSSDEQEYDVSLLSPINIPDELGEYEVDYIVTTQDEYGRDYTRTFRSDFVVEDTNAPVVELSDTKHTVNLKSKFPHNKLIENVYDVVDGDLPECEEEQTSNCWYVEGEYDTAKKGDYTVIIHAIDNHGNETVSEEVKITVKEIVSGGKATYVDFDSRWGVVSGHQAEVDAGYITRWGGDYWHHNWSSFMSQFWQCGVGTTVKLDGRLWRCDGIQKLSTDFYSIIDNSGRNIIGDGTVQLITCATNDGVWRYVMFLTPIG